MIKLSIPHLAGNEKTFVNQAIDSTWIVPLGPFVDQFEDLLENFLHVDNAQPKSVVALSAGTAAIHLGLLLAGVKPGDDVLCQSMTFAASANPIKYIGANPVFVDSEADTWNMSPLLLQRAIEERITATGHKPAAIVAVHLYGMPAKMNEIIEIAEHYDIPIVEDAAEAIGSKYNGQQCGTLGAFGVLSFNGNKMITTSGGGALICPNEEFATKAKFLATQARENKPYYYHETIGYNYRLSNVSAAIGCAQMEVLEQRIARRQAIHEQYSQAFKNNPSIRLHDNPSALFDSNFWLSTILIEDNRNITPEDLRLFLADNDIESRLLWRPMHMQPVYAHAPAFVDGTSERLFSQGLCLPSSTTLTDKEINRVATLVNDFTCK